MKNNIDAFIEKSLTSLTGSTAPTQNQKEEILNKVLLLAKAEDIPGKAWFKNLVFVYPWRFALGASTLQAVVLTAVFGSKYTDLIFQFIGR